MAATIQQRPVYMTTGPSAIKIYSEVLDGCFALGCLSNMRIGYSKNMQPIFCSALAPPIDYRPRNPSFSLDVSARELTALNFHILGGSANDIVTGTALTTANTVGNPAGSSTLTTPAEWWIVKTTGATPWDATVYLKRKDIFAANADSTDPADFVKGADIEIYVAAKTNSDADVAAATTLYESNALTGTASDAAKGSFYVADACNGKIVLGNIPDALVTQWVYQDSDPAFTINGVSPFIQDDIRTGDVVFLVGFAYTHGSVKAADGTQVPRTSRQVIEFPTLVEKPVAVKIVTRYEKDPLRKAKIIRVPRMQNMSGFGLGLNPLSTEIFSLDANFMALDSSDLYPNSPLFHVEIVDADSDISLESLL